MASQPIGSDNATQARVVQTARQGWPARVVWAPNGQLLALAHGEGVSLYRGTLSAPPLTFNAHGGPVKGVAFAPNGATLATGSADTLVKLWDLRAFAPDMPPVDVLRVHTGAVEAVAFAPTGAVASAGTDGLAHLYFNRGHSLRLTGHDGEVNALAFSPNGRTLATGGRDGTVRLWNTLTGEPRAVIPAHTDWARAVAFNPGGNLLLSAGRDGTVRLWDVARDTAMPGPTLAHEGDVRAAAFDMTGDVVASGDAAGAVHFWRVLDGARLHTLAVHARPVMALAFHPRNLWLATAGGDNLVSLVGVLPPQEASHEPQ